jgi:hypothetical protein
VTILAAIDAVCIPFQAQSTARDSIRNPHFFFSEASVLLVRFNVN